MSEAAIKLEEVPGKDLGLYDDLLIPVCAVDEAGTVVYFNSVFMGFMKLSPRKIRNKPIREVIASKVIQNSDIIERCFKDWLPLVSEETTIDVGDEDIRDAIFKLIPHTSPDNSRRVVLSVQDISIERVLHSKHRIQLDELKAKNEEIKKYSEGLELLVDERTKELRESMAQSERLLLNVLPKKIAEILKVSDGTIAYRHDMVTAMFCDICDFTPISATMDPVEVVEFLSRIYDSFDRTLDQYKVEKIKTIGDCYLAVTGAPEFDEHHAINMCNFALDMREEIVKLNETMKFELHARFGINSGPVVAGVIGQRKFTYDVWGDAVNVASRMESHGEPNQIQISEATYDLVKGQFVCEERGIIKVKGKGDFRAFWLISRK